MSISAIDAVNTAANITTSTPLGAANGKDTADFSQWLENELSYTNKQINEADTKLREFAVGQTDNLHEVMIALEKAKSSFELIVEVRNRVLEGYQEIMRMQI